MNTAKFEMLGHYEIPFMDCADRVAQMVILEAKTCEEAADEAGDNQASRLVYE